jgi:NAD(P)-dependent dehydrogenase (short-subunit alcohol dehydrogenase family)
MAIRFDDRVAIVTGAGNGIGRTYALFLAERGAKVVINDLGGSIDGSSEAGARVADKVVDEIKAMGGEAVANYDSVTDGAKIVQTAIDAFGRIDIVINNAGILRDVSFQKMEDKDWDFVQQVHLNGAYAVTRAAWPYMRDQKYGRVVMITSSAGLFGNFGQSNYSAAKLGVVGLCNTLSKEGAKRGINVNVIAPFAASRMTETVLSPDMLEKIKPEYIAPFTCYLCAEVCASNGAIYEVGGGWCSQVKYQRSAGVGFDLNDLKLETLHEKWAGILDFESSPPDYPQFAGDAFVNIMKNLERQGMGMAKAKL